MIGFLYPISDIGVEFEILNFLLIAIQFKTAIKEILQS